MESGSNSTIVVCPFSYTSLYLSVIIYLSPSIYSSIYLPTVICLPISDMYLHLQIIPGCMHHTTWTWNTSTVQDWRGEWDWPSHCLAAPCSILPPWGNPQTWWNTAATSQLLPACLVRLWRVSHRLTSECLKNQVSPEQCTHNSGPLVLSAL